MVANWHAFLHRLHAWTAILIVCLVGSTASAVTGASGNASFETVSVVYSSGVEVSEYLVTWRVSWPATEVRPTSNGAYQGTYTQNGNVRTQTVIQSVPLVAVGQTTNFVVKIGGVDVARVDITQGSGTGITAAWILLESPELKFTWKLALAVPYTQGNAKVRLKVGGGWVVDPQTGNPIEVEVVRGNQTVSFELSEPRTAEVPSVPYEWVIIASDGTEVSAVSASINGGTQSPKVDAAQFAEYKEPNMPELPPLESGNVTPPGTPLGGGENHTMNGPVGGQTTRYVSTVIWQAVDGVAQVKHNFSVTAQAGAVPIRPKVKKDGVEQTLTDWRVDGVTGTFSVMGPLWKEGLGYLTGALPTGVFQPAYRQDAISNNSSGYGFGGTVTSRQKVGSAPLFAPNAPYPVYPFPYLPSPFDVEFSGVSQEVDDDTVKFAISMRAYGHGNEDGYPVWQGSSSNAWVQEDVEFASATFAKMPVYELEVTTPQNVIMGYVHFNTTTGATAVTAMTSEPGPGTGDPGTGGGTTGSTWDGTGAAQPDMPSGLNTRGIGASTNNAIAQALGLTWTQPAMQVPAFTIRLADLHASLGSMVIDFSQSPLNGWAALFRQFVLFIVSVMAGYYFVKIIGLAFK